MKRLCVFKFMYVIKSRHYGRVLQESHIDDEND